MKRQRNIYDPKSDKPFKLSRSKLELFTECPRCFYLDRRLGVGRPSGFPFTLNTAVDSLLKKEFDIHRAKGEPHPLMREYNIPAIPFAHGDLDKWRENFVGVQYWHEPTKFIITGAVDDIWINHGGELMVVDYKATSTTKEISLESEYRQAYKRQMEIYQWLLRRNGFSVSDVGYFVYVNGKADKKAFDKKLEFDVQLLLYKGNDDWVEKTIFAAHKCLNSGKMPKPKDSCAYCEYVKDAVSEL
ncbi:MAG: PD-(D/E)XK nuclease family protein [Candidatus Niyogibacteria bacterium]|nr:PD-(D/E)XK nuclease family protein [Candidatus Niyogibacteria bacterium]